MASVSGVQSSGTFTTPEGESKAGPAGPGKRYSFTVSASPGQRVSFATMFVQSNDLFYAPGTMGLSLFDAGGSPLSGDVTGMVSLWDAGTEMNQEPGIGPDQAPRQAGANTGSAEGGNVVPVMDSFSYPKVDAVIKVTLTPL